MIGGMRYEKIFCGNDVSDFFSEGRPEWCPMKEQGGTGHWIYKKYDDMFMCSCCEKYSIRNDYPYCHWRGAKMEQEGR